MAKQGSSVRKSDLTSGHTFPKAPRFQNTFTTAGGLTGFVITERHSSPLTKEHLNPNNSATIREGRTIHDTKCHERYLNQKVSESSGSQMDSSESGSFETDSLERSPAGTTSFREAPVAEFDPDSLDGGYGSTDTLSDVSDLEDDTFDIGSPDEELWEDSLSEGFSLQQRCQKTAKQRQVNFAENDLVVGEGDPELLEAIQEMRQAESSEMLLPVDVIYEHHLLKKDDNYDLYASRYNQDLTLFIKFGSASMQVYDTINRLMITRNFDKGLLSGKTSKQIFDILCAQKIITVDVILSFLRPTPESGRRPINIVKDVDFEGSPFW